MEQNIIIKIIFDGIRKKFNLFNKGDFFIIYNNEHKDTYIKLQYICPSRTSHNTDALIFKYIDINGPEAAKYSNDNKEYSISQYMLNDVLFSIYVSSDNHNDLYLGQFKMLELFQISDQSPYQSSPQVSKTPEIHKTLQEEDKNSIDIQTSTLQTTEPIRSTRTISIMQGECSMCPYLDNYNMYCNYHMCNISNSLYNAKCTNPELLERKK